LGTVDTILAQPPGEVVGLSWPVLVEKYADEAVRRGLNDAWRAMAGQGVAPAHWPPYLPFRSGVSARLRAVQDDPNIAFAVQLSTQVGCGLDDFLGHSMSQVMERVVRLGRHVFRGVDGPLTDKQVKEVGSVVGYTENLKQLLEDMRSEVLTPFTTAPLALSLAKLLTFSEQDFSSNRRVVTHELSVSYQWSSESVYCYPAVRDIIRRLLETLIVGISAQSTIKLSDRAASPDQKGTITPPTPTEAQTQQVAAPSAPAAPQEQPDQTVRVEIRYRSQEPALQVEQRIEPLDLLDPARFGPVKPIQSLITAAHSCLKPVSGQVWAEPCQAEDATACVVLLLPRWRGPAPD
jgi:hypothetical protein